MKVCPRCGQTFGNDATFYEFRFRLICAACHDAVEERDANLEETGARQEDAETLAAVLEILRVAAIVGIS